MEGLAAAKLAARKAATRTAARREGLRHSPKVKTAGWHFWTAFGKAAPTETITRDEYMRVHRLVARALAPELTAEEAADSAAEDWQEDLVGQEVAWILH